MDEQAQDELSGLVNDCHLNSPSDFAALVARHARKLGAHELVLYLVDYSQSVLVPLPSPQAVDRGELSIERTLAGRAFRTLEMLGSEGSEPGWRRLWVPLLDGTERLGVAEFTFPPDQRSDDVRERVLTYASLTAELLVGRQVYGDVFELVRRRKPMTLAAEIQWRLLPPLTFGTDRLVISGVLEPWDEVGGDTFDYAVNGETAHVAVFDAMGHGLGAALLASVAVAAYRNARRQVLCLAETRAAVHAAVAEHFGGERFVTALFCELDIPSGLLRWVSAGHHSPLLLRGGKIVQRLDAEPSAPLGVGLDTGVPQVGVETLEPGDRLLLYTDGVIEARGADGIFFGVERFGDLAVREAQSGLPAPELLRRLGRALLEHQQGCLQDDATILLLEWAGGGEQVLLPNG